METWSLDRSRAEIAFAAFLTRCPDPRDEDVEGLCGEHPELAGELRRIERELANLRSVNPRVVTGEAPAFPPPPHLGSFRCRTLLGRGGMGEVWEARDDSLDRDVAVKVMREALLLDEPRRQRFHREALAAGRVHHPGIVSIFSAGEWEGRPYLVQELVPGGRTLRDEIAEAQRRGEPPPGHARSTAERFVRLCDALENAHRSGVVHRDLKPQNVLLTPGGEPKVADFGLASLTDDVAISRTGEFLGTYLYASPEQLEGGRRPVDARSDVFSLGATLYECLTLDRPFGGDSVPEVVHAVTFVDPPAPHVVRSRIPRDLSMICMKALEKQPTARYATMRAFGDDLRRFLESRPVEARPPSGAQRAHKWVRRHPTAASTLALGALAIAALSLSLARSERLRRDASESARIATEQARQAREEASTRKELFEFLIGILGSADPVTNPTLDTPVRDVVAAGVQRIHESGITDPGVRARLLAATGTIYGNLGAFAESRELLAQSVEAWEAAGTPDDPEAIDARVELGLASVDNGRVEEASALLEPVVARWRADGGPPTLAAVRALRGLGWARLHANRFEESDALLREAEAAARSGCPDHPDTWYLARDARTQLAMARGDYAQAERLAREDVEERAALASSGSGYWIHALGNLAQALQREGKLDEAEAHALDAVDAAQRSFGSEHPFTLQMQLLLSEIWVGQGRHDEAQTALEEMLADWSRTHSPRDHGSLFMRAHLANCLLARGRSAEGIALLRELVPDLEASMGPGALYTLTAMGSLAQALAADGRPAEAAEVEALVVDRLPAGSPGRAQAASWLERYRASASAGEN